MYAADKNHTVIPAREPLRESEAFSQTCREPQMTGGGL